MEKIRIPKFRIYPIILAAVVILLGISVILGWILDIPVLKSILPEYISMKFNTALCFILTAAALIYQSVFSKKRKKLLLSVYLFVLALSIASYLQEAFNLDLGLDQLIINDDEAVRLNQPYPGRMSPITSLLFALMSIGLILLNFVKKPYRYISQYIFHLVTFFSIIALTGYLYNVPDLYTLNFLVSMAVHTSAGFLMLSIAGSLLNPKIGIISIFFGKKVGNVMARQLFSQITLAIFFFSYLRYLSYKYKLLNAEFSIALLTICFVVISLFIIGTAARRLNVKDRKKQLAEKQFKLVVESAPNGLVMADSKGVIRLVNAQAEKIFGYNREVMIGAKIEMLVPASIAGHHSNNRAAYHRRPTVRHFGPSADLHARRSDGTEFPIEIGLTPIEAEKERMVLASLIDITERKEQENIIKKQLIELQVKNQEMEQFNYIASHDLQEPLRTVANYIMLLEEDYPELFQGEVKQHLGTINSAVSRMSLLVRSLLDFGRLGRNRKLTSINCQKLVYDVLADLDNLINANDAQVVIEGKLPVINAYETELRQLFQNLINNAVKFKKQDSPVVVTIGCNFVFDGYEFYVSDNGIGINPRYSERIFQIFQRLNKETEYEGHGIGLANCRKIAEIHGGKIWVESVVGEGSTFKFIISKLKNEHTGKLHNAG